MPTLTLKAYNQKNFIFAKQLLKVSIVDKKNIFFYIPYLSIDYNTLFWKSF